MSKKSQMITPAQLLEKRTQLVNKYGEKIIKGQSGGMTNEEKAACILYRTMSNELHKAVPDTINPEKVYEFYIRNGVHSVFGLIAKYAIKTFWVFLAVAIFVAIIKYIFT